MGRPRRAADGGIVYHVLNRANARMPIFESDQDFAASHPTAVAEAMHKVQDASDNQDFRQRFGVSPAIAVGSGLS